MSTRRRSIISHGGIRSHSRASIISLYSATYDSTDGDKRQKILQFFSKVFIHKKIDIYHVLERQEGTHTLAYHLFVFALTLISLVFGSISTIDEWRTTLDTPLYYGELALCIFFACELLIRIWSAGGIPKYQTWVGRLMFIKRPSITLDILTLFGFTISLATGVKTREFPSLTLKFLPPLQMIRFLRVDRQLSSWRVLKGIIIKHRQELTVTLVIAFMFLITGSYLVYVAETPIDPSLNKGRFKSAADTMWFSIITMTTIGFGDLYPTTYIAKMITTTICFLGVAFWCLPTGIIGSGLAIKVQEQKRDEALSRLVPAAATVIRNWWRLRCFHHHNRFVSTWKIYSIIPRRVRTYSSTKPTRENVISIVEPTDDPSPGTDLSRFQYTTPIQMRQKLTHVQRHTITNIDELPKRYITAIKVFRTLKYSVACKKFSEAKRPVDIKDVVKQNTQMNSRLSSMLNDVQRRLDLVLGTARPASYMSDAQKRQLSLSGRIEKIEEATKRFETKLNQLESLAASLVKNA